MMECSPELRILVISLFEGEVFPPRMACKHTESSVDYACHACQLVPKGGSNPAAQQRQTPQTSPGAQQRSHASWTCVVLTASLRPVEERVDEQAQNF